MDQQTFWMTMKELLGGNHMFFGSPLEIFLLRLKGGFYPPKVTRFREGLQFLQNRKFYHSLRSYHENMTQMFSDMRRVWDQYKPGISVEERGYIWMTKNNQKVMDPLYLNAYPTDEDMLSKEVNSSSQKKIYLKSKGINTHIFHPPVANGVKFVALNTNGKGVMKIKPSGMNSFQTEILKAVPSDTWAICRSTPKGLLKIVPKCPSSQQEHRKAVPIRPVPTPLVDASGLQTSRFSPLPAHQWDAGDYAESSFLDQAIGGRKTCRSSEPPDCIMDGRGMEILYGTIGPSRNLRRSTTKIKRAKDLSSDGISNLQEHNLFGGDRGTWKRDGRVPKGGHEPSMKTLNVRRYACESEKLWRNLGAENSELSWSSMEPCPFANDYKGKQHMAPVQENHITMYPRISEVVPRIPEIGIEEQKTLTASLDRMKGHKDVNVGGLQKLCDLPTVLEGLRDGLMHPITYKRRKAQTNLNSLDFYKPLNAGADFYSRTSKESNHHLGKCEGRND